MHVLDRTLLDIYGAKRDEIALCLEGFVRLREGADDVRLFEELAFCTLTPQAKPLEAQKTIEHLKHLDLLLRGTEEDVSPHLHRVRFRHTKARSLVYNRQLCFADGFSLRERLQEMNSPREQRRFLVETMRGIGWKEASHFLRNTGFGLDLAILDRHVLRSMEERFGYPPCLPSQSDRQVPRSFNALHYEIGEQRLQEWARLLDIPFPFFDFVIFYAKTGVIFK